MKTLKYLGIACVASVALSSCSDSSSESPSTPNTDPNAHYLKINTTVQIKSSVVTELKDGDKMNVFVKKTESPTGTDVVSNIVASRTANGWELSPEVPLSKGDVFYVYAVSPYNPANTDASSIPVDVAQQVDLMYSGATVCSYQTNDITLTMKHALALMTFDINKSGYSGDGVINSLSVNGDLIYTKGTMNASSGRIIGTEKTQVTVDMNHDIDDDGTAKMWVIPFANKSNPEGAILTAVIDGKTYTITVPEVEMKLGWQYAFKLALTNYGLSFIPGGLETISLNGEGSEVAIPGSHGVVSFKVNGSKWTTPSFFGNGVFGNTLVGTTSTTYQSGAELEVNGSTVSVETWNSNGFSIDSLEGVDEVDITQY